MVFNGFSSLGFWQKEVGRNSGVICNRVSSVPLFASFPLHLQRGRCRHQHIGRGGHEQMKVHRQRPVGRQPSENGSRLSSMIRTGTYRYQYDAPAPVYHSGPAGQPVNSVTDKKRQKECDGQFFQFKDRLKSKFPKFYTPYTGAHARPQ